MVQGRKPTPERLKTANMNVATFGVLEPPEYLAGYALEEWNRIIHELQNNRIGCSADQAVLGMYCETYGFWRQLRDQLAIEGCIITLSNGKKSHHPATLLIEKYVKQLVTIAKELGFTPASRRRMHIKTKQEETRDGLDEFNHEE